MAKIVFGLGTSHGPMLSTPPELWHLRVGADRKNRAHPFRGKTYSFEELAELRKGENLAAQLTPGACRERHARCQQAIATLGRKLAEAAPDIVLIFGNDQREVFLEELNPAFAVFHGDTVTNAAIDPEDLKHMDPGIVPSVAANKPPADAVYPCVPALAEHIARAIVADGFDVAVSKRLPKGRHGDSGLPHAFGFVYRRIMNDQPVPAVPFFVNTFYPPNQATPGRCYAFGQAVARAVGAWPGEQRIAVIASGGLSHFVIDEEFDARMLEAMRRWDEAAFAREPAPLFQSGTSETKNWIAAIGAMAGHGLSFNLVDYVPCYRSEAGTGSAMAFAFWD